MAPKPKSGVKRRTTAGATSHIERLQVCLVRLRRLTLTVYSVFLRPSLHSYFFASFCIYFACAIAVAATRAPIQSFFCAVAPQSGELQGMGCANCDDELLMCDKALCYRTAVNITFLRNATTSKQTLFQAFNDAALDTACNDILAKDGVVTDPIAMIMEIARLSATVKVTDACKTFHCGVMKNAMIQAGDTISPTGNCTNVLGAKPPNQAGNCVCQSLLQYPSFVAAELNDSKPDSVAMKAISSVCGPARIKEMQVLCSWTAAGVYPKWCPLITTTSTASSTTTSRTVTTSTTTTRTTTKTTTTVTTKTTSVTTRTTSTSTTSSSSSTTASSTITRTVTTSTTSTTRVRRLHEAAGAGESFIEEATSAARGGEAEDGDEDEEHVPLVLAKSNHSGCTMRPAGAGASRAGPAPIVNSWDALAPAPGMWEHWEARELQTEAEATTEAETTTEADTTTTEPETTTTEPETTSTEPETTSTAEPETTSVAAEATTEPTSFPAPEDPAPTPAAPTPAPPSSAAANSALPAYQAKPWSDCTCYQQCVAGVRTRVVACLAAKCQDPKPPDKESCKCDHCAACDIDLRLLVFMIAGFTEAFLALLVFLFYLRTTVHKEDDFIKMGILKKIQGFWFKQLPGLLRTLVLAQLFQILYFLVDTWLSPWLKYKKAGDPNLGTPATDAYILPSKDCFASKDLRTVSALTAALWVFQVMLGRCAKRWTRKPDWLYVPERPSWGFPFKQIRMLIRSLGP